MASLALRDPEERADSFYRFSVKCDRLTNLKIASAARKAGMSVNSFVQRHFETILDVAPASLAAQPTRFDAPSFARRHNVTIQAANLWLSLSTHARNGLVQRSLKDLAADVGVPRVELLIERLVAAGTIEIVAPSSGLRPAIYRVPGEGEASPQPSGESP
ncbi:hypothetical protein EFV37_25190 [Mesorhizobium loti]|uniref:Uncharacterized protein n=1 Tax=Mesorhizobium jarvisii TaxID=1777867 RepID=A0A6M7TK60_9HYPH|nr:MULTISPECIES: hypothetical protein [Mesorhizobium]OBQ68386.1 hypothetical protein A9K72_09025 [Mesorhizobium loti]QKC65195.1 hypothetical protein EB229_25185 [Mesorhizobium jarvisii]QKD11110.1 hypothetical protein EFV37_25190 [Mesorhizobium loti]RJT31084.1 hypothetical protein D3242_22750 [Mesorhizobium jarvisii]